MCQEIEALQRTSKIGAFLVLFFLVNEVCLIYMIDQVIF